MDWTRLIAFRSMTILKSASIAHYETLLDVDRWFGTWICSYRTWEERLEFACSVFDVNWWCRIIDLQVWSINGTLRICVLST